MNQPPSTLVLNGAGIPDDLKAIPQWVCWGWTFRKDKWTKPPISPRSEGMASSTDPGTWAPYGAAMRYARQNRLPGIGLVLTHDAGIVAVDLDKCVGDDGIAPWALEMVLRFSTYTELSPTGRGLHLFCAGLLPIDGRKVGAIEVYQAGRYMTVTGHRWDESFTDVAPTQDAVDWLLAKLGPAKEKPAIDWVPSVVPAINLRERAAGARIRRDTLALLDNTGAAHYPSASEADSAIACALIGAGFTPDETLSLILDSVRGIDAGRRKGPHVNNYWHRTISHAEAFASKPAEIYGVPVRYGNGARVIRSLAVGSRYSQIHTNDFRESVNNVNRREV